MSRLTLLMATKSGSLEEAIQYIQNPKLKLPPRYYKFVTRCHWSPLNTAIKHLRVIIEIGMRCTDGEVSCWAGLKGSENFRLSNDNLFHDLKVLIHRSVFARLLIQASGPAFYSISLHRSSFFFMREMWGLSATEWKFLHRARMGEVRLHSPTHRGAPSGNCKFCSLNSECARHVLSFCTELSGLATARHNFILYRLVRAAAQAYHLSYEQLLSLEYDITRGKKKFYLKPLVVLYMESTPEDCVDMGRPDFILIDDISNGTIILDVTITFELSQQSLHEAQEIKKAKYQSIKSHFESLGYTVTLDAFVVGTLGSWYPNNSKVLELLGCPLS